MSIEHLSQNQGSPTMAARSSNPYPVSVLTSPLLPTSSPEALFEPDNRQLSTSSTPLAASSETTPPLPSPSAVRQRMSNTSVSFVEHNHGRRSPSASSVRSHPSLLRQANGTTTPPRSPALGHATSSNPIDHSVFGPSPKLSTQNSRVGDIHKAKGSPEPSRRTSQDRRARSEGSRLGAGGHRPSLIGNKNPSVVTGGWQTSESESNTPNDTNLRKNEESSKPPSFPAFPSASFHGTHPAHFVVQDRRKRAQSLTTAGVDDLRSSGEGSGRSRSSSRVSKDRDPGPMSAQSAASKLGRDRSDSRSSRLSESFGSSQPLDKRNSQAAYDAGRLAKSPTRLSGTTPHSPLSSAMNSRVPSASTYFRESHAESSRHASFRSARESPNRDPHTSPTQHLRDLPARSREVERLRREEGVSTPESSKGKGKMRETARSSGIASSFGLGVEKETLPAEQVALNPDQINELLGDSDVGAALRMLQESVRSSPGFTRDKDHIRRPSVSTRSPDVSRRIEPFIATAPPALIRNDDTHSRDRTVSVSSSLAPSHSGPIKKSSWDDGEMARRRRQSRRRSSTVADGDGGHVPYTHHMPVRVNEALASSDDDADNDDIILDEGRQTSVIHEDAGSYLAPTDEETRADGGQKKRKSRFSGLFNRRKKSYESITKEVTKPAETHKHHTLLPDKHDHAKSREQYEKDLVIRRLERERREAELLEELKYKAFIEVSAHPAAGRMADRAISHLRAYYYQVYDSIDNPPRLNYLSVIRWKRATLEQNENRARWKAEQAERHKDPTSFPSAWTGMYNSPNSVGSAAQLRPSVSRDSQPLSFSTTGTGGNLRSSVSTTGNGNGRDVPGSGWRYTIEDIVAYKEANGKINYFMPPKEDPESLLSASMNKSQTSQSNKLDDYRPNAVGEPREIDLASSVASGTRMGNPTPRIISASMLSVNAIGGTTSPSSSHANLTRTTSIETAARAPKSPVKPPGRTLGHRPHQSMSAMTGSTTNLANMVRAPFHRIKEGVRKQTTLPYPSGPQFNGSESAIDESPIASRARPRTSGNTPAQRTPIDHARSRNVLRRHTHDLPTDDDRHDNHDLHRTTGLFLKGRFPFHWNRRHEDNTIERADPKDTIEGVRDWSQILEREKRFEARLPGKRRPTLLVQEAEKQLARYAADEYVERSKAITSARTRVDSLTAALGVANRSMSFFLHEIGQIQQASRISAEIDLDFPGLDELQQRYANISRRNHDWEDGATTPPWIRSQPPSRRGSRRISTLGAAASPAFYSVGAKPWPRRTIIDKHGDRIDPIRQVETALDEALDRESRLEHDKRVAVTKLQGIDKRLDDIISQKQAVKEWLDKSHQAIRKKQDSVAHLQRELNAGWRLIDVFGSHADLLADVSVRYILGYVVRFCFSIYNTLAYIPGPIYHSGPIGKVVGSILAVAETLLVITCLIGIVHLYHHPDWALNWCFS